MDHLRWKLQPAKDDPLSQVVATAEGAVIATQLRFVQAVDIRGRRYRSYAGVDVAVDSAWQGRGLFSAVRHYRATERDAAFDIHIGVTNNGRGTRSQR